MIFLKYISISTPHYTMGYGICEAHGLHGCDINPPPRDTRVRRGFTGYVFHITPLLLGGFEPRSLVVTDQTDLSTIQ
jgi:hypothetical protein